MCFISNEKWQLRQRVQLIYRRFKQFGEWNTYALTPGGERGKQKKWIASSGQFAQKSGRNSFSDIVKPFFSALIDELQSQRCQWTCGGKDHIKCLTRPVELNKLWNDFHAILSLPQPDVILSQTVNRLSFNIMLWLHA